LKLRLSSKLVLSIVVIEAVMLSVLVWNSVRLISTSHGDVLTYNLNSEASLLANLLAPGLAVEDGAIVDDALSLIKKNKNITYARVTDESGDPVAYFGNVPVEPSLDNSFEDARLSGTYDIQKPILLFEQNLGELSLGYSVAYVEELITKTRLQNTLIASGELILSIIMTLIVGYLLTQSLRKLEAGATALARDELEHRIDLDSQDEMGDLARSFNSLASHLVRTRRELFEEHNILEKQTEHLRSLLNGIDAVILEIDPVNMSIKYVSDEAEKLLGYPVEDWYQQRFLLNKIHPDDKTQFKDKFELSVEGQESSVIDFRLMHYNDLAIDVRSITTTDTEVTGEKISRCILLDITEQKKNEERIVYLADHDSLTGLFNRHRFQLELERAVEYAHRFGSSGALMFIDLDQFKYINDTLGHQIGDKFLKQTADRLSAGIRKVDVLGRLGGDEFGIILPRTSKEDAQIIADKILTNLVDGLLGSDSAGDTTVTASIGIVMFPEQGDVPDNLLAMADTAMYSAKDRGRNTYRFYDDKDQHIKSMQEKLQWENKIRSALDEDNFVLHFQPIFDLQSRCVIHYEALLRMKDKDGLIMPSTFLDIAERFGLIREIDHWVLKKSIQVQAKSIEDNRPVSLAINISGRHFGDPKVLEWIRAYINDSGADPEKLIFEITETAAVENTEQARYFTNELHKLGCKIALDDFGIGFSSFHYLKHMPVDLVKLDGSFVRNLGSDDFDRVFVKAMSDMASGLKIKCIAEFVEREEVVEILKELNVEMGQGFHLARPAEKFID